MKRIFIIAFSILICLFFLGKFLDYHYKKFWSPFFDKLDVVFKDTGRYDGIYLGDSRVHFGINPYYTDSVTGMRSYNIGMGGANVNEIYFLADAFLSNHPAPKYAVISVGYSDILQSYKHFENPCYYFFYMGNNVVDSALATANYHVTLFKCLPIFKYTAFDDFNKVSISKNLHGEGILKGGGIAYNGFINNSTDFFNANQLINPSVTDTRYENGIKKLEEILLLFKKNNCLPILVYPPVISLSVEQNNPLYFKIDTAIKNIAATYAAPLLRFDTDTSFTPSFFTDAWHVNIPGSKMYSIKLANAIKEIIKQRSN